MAKWVLSCALKSSWVQVRTGLGPFLTELGFPGTLVCVRRTPQRDLNGGDGTFTASWVAGPVTLEESILSGSGNPRDGWGYDLRLELRAPTLHLQITSSGWTPGDSVLQGMLEGSAEAFLALRRVLSTLGTDGTDQPYLAVANIEAARGEPALQRRLLDAALQHGSPGSYGWRELLLIQSTLDGPNLERRLLETPEDAMAWRDAADAPLAHRPPDLTPELCLERAHRLMPELARASTETAASTAVERLRLLWETHPRWPGSHPVGSSAGWFLHAHTLEPGASFPALVFQAARKLFPDACPVDAPPAYLREPLTLGEAQVTGQAWARSSARGLAIVCQRDVRIWAASWKKASIRGRLAMKPNQQTLFTWLWDDVPGSEGLLLFVESLDRHKGRLRALGVEAHWSGPPAFLARVDEALRGATPYPWVSVVREK